jgi:hypothetical protein
MELIRNGRTRFGEVDADHGNILNEPQVQHLSAAIRAASEQAWLALSELQTLYFLRSILQISALLK